MSLYSILVSGTFAILSASALAAPGMVLTNGNLDAKCDVTNPL